MTDLIGRTIGQYQIIERIGKGGMADVYKAYQPGLDRYVAIKILPEYFLRDETFLARFEREAKAVAKLDHPNILPVYDYGREGDITYIAMKYVEAGSLKEKLGQPLPLDTTVDILSQVAGALDHAHKQGIIHRDVKPSNVLMSEGGWALLTDFGLAKMAEATVQLTGSGVGVGTPAYMSPEQGQGKAIDARSDVYSLGVMLYEMLTGRVPYEAETPMAVVIKHISAPLPLPRMVNPAIPEAVERVVLKALAKDPTDRYQSAGELAEALKKAVATSAVPLPTEAKPVEPVSAAPPEIEVAPETVPVPPVVKVKPPGVVPPPPAVAPATVMERARPRAGLPGWGWVLVGTMVFLCLAGAVLGVLWKMRPLLVGTATPTSIARMATATRPAPTTGPVAVTPTPVLTSTSLPPTPTAIRMPTYTPVPPLCSGHIAFTSERDGNQEIYVMNADGSGQTNLTNHEASDKLPSWSLDGRRIAFESNRGAWDAGLFYLMNPDGSGMTNVPNTRDSHNPACSPDCTRIAFESRRDDNWEIYVVNDDGSGLTRLTNDPARDENPSWSPDGTRIAFMSERDDTWGDIYVTNADGNGQTNLTNMDRGGRSPVWSPDGTRIAFIRGDEIYVMNADPSAGSGQGGSGLTRLTDNPAEDLSPAWSPDGRCIAFTRVEDTNGDDSIDYYDAGEIYVMNADGSAQTNLTNNQANDSDPAWGP